MLISMCIFGIQISLICCQTDRNVHYVLTISVKLDRQSDIRGARRDMTQTASFDLKVPPRVVLHFNSDVHIWPSNQPYMLSERSKCTLRPYNFGQIRPLK